MNTEKEPLKNLLKQKFGEIELSVEQLDALKKTEPKFARWQSTPWWAVACLSVFLILASVFLTQDSDENLMVRISKEVSTNHLYAKPLDLSSNSLDEITDFFDRLDFNPVLVRPSFGDFKLVGGRYCTLQGQIALLLRFQDSNGAKLTYYLTKDSQTFAKIPSTQKTAQMKQAGVEVTMWREAGLMVATAVGV